MKKILLISALCAFALGVSAQSTTYKNTLTKMLEAGGSEATFKVAVKQMFENVQATKDRCSRSNLDRIRSGVYPNFNGRPR